MSINLRRGLTTHLRTLIWFGILTAYVNAFTMKVHGQQGSLILLFVALGLHFAMWTYGRHRIR